MSVSKSEFTPSEAAYLANVCLAATSLGREEADLRVGVDWSAMIERVRAVAPREVSINTVNKAIEAQIVTYRLRADGRAQRMLNSAAILYLASSRMLKITLSKEMKTNVYRTLSQWTKEGHDRSFSERPFAITFSKHLTFDLGDDFGLWSMLVRRYVECRTEHITTDPDIMGGQPIVKGTRVPVHSILEMVDGGDSIERILEDFPYLSEAAVEAAVIYSRAHPKTGRPKRFR